MALQSYHYAWLSKRSDRSAEWLQDRLREGFDVHHLDGNHQNDSPSNLVLIEHSDHMELHNFPMRRVLAYARQGTLKGERVLTKLELRREQGRRAYELKRGGYTWGQVGAEIGLGPRNTSGDVAAAVAREFAQAEGLPWPKPKSSLRGGFHGLKRVNGEYVKAYGPHLPKLAATEDA